MLNRIANGRTDLVFAWIAQGHPATATHGGAELIQHCAYFGDVSALRYLLQHGAVLTTLGDNLGLGAAAFHGHWQLCQFLIEQEADVNQADTETGETALHAALSKGPPQGWMRAHATVQVLLAAGANPNAATKPGVETGCFMRDCRTKGETPLHRAAAFASAETVALLLSHGANRESRDASGDTPLAWASWYNRPDAVLRPLLYGEHRIHPDHQEMETYLRGTPAPD